MGNDFIGAHDVQTPRPALIREALPDDPQKGALTTGGVAALLYARALVVQWRTSKPLLYRRVRDAPIWDLFFRRPINRDFYVSLFRISGDEFDALTAPVGADLIADILGGRLNPFFLFDRLQVALRERAANDDEPEYVPGDVEKVLALIVESRRLCASRDIPFIVVILPDSYEVQPELVGRFLREMGYPRIPKRLEQLTRMHRQLVDGLAANEVPVCDPIATLRASSTPSYYPLDQHLTPAGHEIVATELYHSMEAIIPVR